MSIALLVFIQPLYEIFPAKNMALQCFQTRSHRSFFIAIQQIVSKASKKYPKINLVSSPPG